MVNKLLFTRPLPYQTNQNIQLYCYILSYLHFALGTFILITRYYSVL